MKKILIAAIFTPVFFSSCDDTRLWGLEPDKVYLKQNGVLEEVAYDLDRTETVELWAVKSGYRGESTTVKFSVNPELILRHNEEYGTDFKMIPDGCYEVDTPREFEIKGTDQYAKFSFKYDTGKILEKAYQGAYDRSGYVLPIQIRSSDVMITDEIETGDYALINFSIREPVIEILNGNYSDLSFTVGEEGVLNYSFDVGMPFRPDTDVAYTFTEDDAVLQSIVDGYNASSSVQYTLAPREAYSMLTTDFTVGAGTDRATVEFNVDKSLMPFGNHLIVLALGSADAPMSIGENSHIILPVSVVTERIDRSNWTVTASSSSTAAGETLESIIDDNINTFWHLAYGGVDNNPRLLYDMGESRMMYQVEIWPRRFDQGGNGTSLIGCAVYASETPLGIDDDWGEPIADVNIQVVATTMSIMINVEHTQARYFLLKMRRNTNQVGINEVYVRGQ